MSRRTHQTRSRHSVRRAGFGVCAVVLATLACSVVWPAAAQAAAYRYWTYWQGTAGDWSFATAGPASLVPADGSIEGWRFAVTTQAGRAGDSPGAEPDFDGICAGTPAAADRKRVAVVIDAGTSADAPEGQIPPAIVATCVLAPPEATGYQVLRSIATVRTDGGLVCGIAGYPAGECAPVVDDATPAGSDSAEPSAPASAPVSAADPASVSSPAPSSLQPTTSAMTVPGGTGSGTPWITLVVAGFAAVVALLLWRRHRAR